MINPRFTIIAVLVRGLSTFLRRFGSARLLAARRGAWLGLAGLAVLPATSAIWLPAASGQEQATVEKPRFVRLRVGFDDLYKVGNWTPFELSLRGGLTTVVGRVELTLLDGDGVPTTVVSPRPVQLVPGHTTSVLIYAKPGRLNEPMSVVFRAAGESGGRALAKAEFRTDREGSRFSFPPAMFSTQQLFVGVGPSIGLETAANLIGNTAGDLPDGDIQVAQLENIDQLPTRWFGYESVDWLVLSTSRAEAYRQLTSTSARIEALDAWIARGGRLLLLAGQQAPELLAPGAPLSRFAPGRFDRMVTLGIFNAIEQYSGSTIPIRATRSRPSIEVPRFVDLQGTVEAREGELPLVVRRPYGFGEIVFVGLDLDQPPWKTWDARPKLVARLIGRTVDQLDQSVQSAQPWAGGFQSGFNDLSGQMRAALDRFSGVRVAPFWLVAMLVFAYIFWIGPIDYLIVKRIFRRMELTWVTFPLVVVLVSVGAYALARWMKGDDLLVNQVDLVDVDVQSGLLRGTCWLNVFSPRVASYDIDLRPRLPDGGEAETAHRLLSWMGLPGEGLGGMHSQAADPLLWARPYGFQTSLDRLIEVPIQVWSTKSFVQRWSVSDYDSTQVIDPQLSTRGGFLEGAITSRLDVPLENCLLAFGRWAYPLRTLEPGETFRIDPLRDPRMLQAELTGRSTFGVAESDRAKNLGYDLYSDDPVKILRQMMFYKAAGGAAYTRLYDRDQSFVDLSDHLELGRAILVGFVQRPAARLQLNGKTPAGPRNRHWSCLRFVIPLEEM